MMRTGVAALGALSLVNLAAAAKPAGHHRRHQQLHEKRDDVNIVYETDYTYATVALPDVVVYVDENGNPYSTSTEGQAAATSASVVASTAPVYVAPTAPAYVAPTAPAYVAPTTLASVYTSKASTSAAAATTVKAPLISVSVSLGIGSGPKASSSAPPPKPSSPSKGGLSGYGVVYSPYSDSGNCKSQDDVMSDFAKIQAFAQSNGDVWKFVRIYGVDCNQIVTVLSACAKYDLKLFAGIFNIDTEDSLRSDLQILIKAVNGDWSRIDTISIGNEVVNNGKLTPDQVGARVTVARSVLSAAGYCGKIVAVDTLVAVVANPSLCKYSDYVAVNAHAFFDSKTVAKDAGKWLLESMQRVSEVCGGKETFITETGWPKHGMTNGLAVPSVENQKAALASIKEHVTSNVILLSAFNDMWKHSEAATFGAEQYWGICD